MIYFLTIYISTLPAEVQPVSQPLLLLYHRQETPADVISLFSNAYTNKTVDSWSAEWDDSDVADLQVAGDDVKKYTFTNFAGIDFSNHKFDASGMTHFHMDIWTPDEVQDKSLTVKLLISEAVTQKLQIVSSPLFILPVAIYLPWQKVHGFQ